MNDRNCHDIENATGVGVLRIGEFVIPSKIVVGAPDLPVYLPSICPFEVDAVVTVRLHGAANLGVRHLLIGDLLDVESFLVADGELGADLVDHVLHRDFEVDGAARLLVVARLEVEAVSAEAAGEADGQHERGGKPLHGIADEGV